MIGELSCNQNMIIINYRALIMIDYQNSIHLVRDRMRHERTKRIDVSYHFF
jgi:hypothetical protein